MKRVEQIKRARVKLDNRNHLTTEELANIFNGSRNAIKVVEEIMRQHDELEAVTIHPDTWVGKEVLRLSKRVIDLREDMHQMQRSINTLTKAVNITFQEVQKTGSSKNKETTATTVIPEVNLEDELRENQLLLISGKITINEARLKLGLESLPEKHADLLFIKSD